MVPKRRWLELIVLVAGCSAPPAKPTAPPPSDPLVASWKIADHVMATTSALTEDDALVFHDRIVEIDATGYTTPWHGDCEEAVRQRRDRILADVLSELDVPAAGRARARSNGLVDDMVEHRLTCNDKGTPPLTFYLSGERAMTCFTGVCYFLKR